MKQEQGGLPVRELVLTVQEGDEWLPDVPADGMLRRDIKWVGARLFSVEKKRDAGRVYQAVFHVEQEGFAEFYV